MPTFYTPSGKIGPLSYLYLAGACLFALPIAGLIYAYAIWYMPFIYINFLFAAGFGFVIGFLINLLVIRLGKVRNKKMAFIFCLLGILSGLYFHWVSWVDLVINAGDQVGSEDIGITVSNVDSSHLISLATNPSALFSLIGTINEFGTWGIKGAAISGTFLTIIWVIEFLIILVVALMIGTSSVSVPFCEESNQWFSHQDSAPFELVSDPDQFITAVDENNHEYLEQLKLADNFGTQHHSVFTLYSSDRGESYVSVNNKMAKVDNEGKVTFDDTWVITNLAIDKNVFNILTSKQ